MKNLSFENIAEWPLVTKLLVYGLACALTVFMGYKLSLSSQVDTLSTARHKEKDLRDQIQFIVKKNKKIEEEVAKLPELQKLLAEWDKQLINYNALPELLNDILKVGNNNNLTFNLFTPGDPEKLVIGMKEKENKNGDKKQENTNAQNPQPTSSFMPHYNMTVYKVEIKTVVVGTYHDIANFVSEVANLPWIVSVGNFSIGHATDDILKKSKSSNMSDNTGGGLLVSRLQLDVYYLPEG